MKEIIIPLGTVQKVLVKATKEGMAPSDIGEYEYTVLEGKVATPEIVPDETTSGKFTITCATEGAAIYYTTNGDTPTEDDTLYEEAVTLEATATVKAKAFKTGWLDSLVDELEVVYSEGYEIQDEDAQAFVDACTTKPDDADAEALDTFVAAVKTSGAWAKVDCLKLLANWDGTGTCGSASTAYLNLKNPSKFKSATAGGTVTHTKYTGVSGAGTGYIKDGYNMTAASINATKDSVAFGVWVQAAVVEVEKSQFSAKGTYGLWLCRRWNTTPAAMSRACSANKLTNNINHTTGMLSIIRDSAAYTYHKIISGLDYSGAVNCVTVSTGETAEDVDLHILGDADGGKISSDTLALSWVGAGLTSTEFDNFADAVSAWLTHIFSRAT